jgi:hypothetical protein
MPTVATSTNIENIQFHQQSGAPSTPAANYYRLYLKSDGLYYINSAAAEVKVASAAAFAAQTANTFLSGPTSAGPTVPTFRAIVAADLTSALVSPPAIGGTTPAAGSFTNLTATTAVLIDRAAGTSRSIFMLSGSSTRWEFGALSDAESGSNAGSSLAAAAYSDAGSFLELPWIMSRANGVITQTVFDAATNSVSNQLVIQHSTSGTPAAGLGVGTMFSIETSAGFPRESGRVRFHLTNATDASRTVRGTLSANDSAGERDCIMWEASGSATMVGFQGTAPIVKPTVTGSRGGNAALASLLTALANYGLIVDSSS